MYRDELPGPVKVGYVQEIVDFLNWAAGEGFVRMGMLTRMIFPSVATDDEGMKRIREYLDVIHREGFTADTGIPTIELLVAAGRHLVEFGAPVPGWEALSALKSGALGNSRSIFRD